MRLVLHVGTHKTGTTTIQKVLADNASWLADLGFHYPLGRSAFGSAKLPHHNFARAATLVEADQVARAGKFVQECESAAASGRTVIVSTEAIYKHVHGHLEWNRFRDPDYWSRRLAYFQTLARWLERFDVEVLIYLRERSAFAESLYRELVLDKARWQGEFPDFLSGFEPWFDYEKQVACLRAAFGAVRVESYDAAQSEGLVDCFFRTIGLPPPPVGRDAWERASRHPGRLFPSDGEARAFARKWDA